jgi:hypothetical protein
MYARVRSSSAKYGSRCPTEFGNRGFEDSLNSPFARLPLPPGKPRAIVVHHELHGTRQHRVKLSAPSRLSRNVTR